jgi:hypothetical protein
MSDNEKTKEAIAESLERNFIDNKSIVEREMNMLNVLISSFENDGEYTYDEYCKRRMQFELEACDSALDIDIDKEMSISQMEKGIIQNRAVRKTMGNPEVDYEDALKEEYIKWQIQKCYDIDKKMYYQISKYSSSKLLENKISKETWEKKKKYFEEICEDKARNYGNAAAEANKDKHEEDIRSSMI